MSLPQRIFIVAALLIAGRVDIASGASLTEVGQAALDAAHDGRFDRAERLLRSHAGDRHASPELDFRLAFVTYWRLLYDLDNPALRDRFESELERVIDHADDRHRASDALWRGSAHLLLAQLKASEKKPFGALREAKRARRHLIDAAEHDRRHAADSDFGLGVYDYYVGQLAGIVRGLLFIPGGDREGGLDRLRRSAREADVFALESRIVLAATLAEKKERRYEEALREADRAIAAHPDRVAVLHGAAKLDVSLFRTRVGLERLERALRVAENHDDVDPAVVDTVRFHAARAALGRFRPDVAFDYLAPLLADIDRVNLTLRDAVRRLSRRALTVVVDAPANYPRREDWDPVAAWGEQEARFASRAAIDLERAISAGALAIDGAPSRDVEILEKLSDAAQAEGAPPSPTLDLLLGRALLRTGDFERARDRLDRAIASNGLPRLLESAALLLSGMAADVAGDREAALARYDRAEENRSFPTRDACYRFQERPCEPEDLEEL